MNSRVDKSFRRQPESILNPFISLAFWVLAVMILVNIHWLSLWEAPMVRPIGYSIILISCLFLLYMTGSRLRKFIVTPALFLLATIISYLIIASAVSLTTDGVLSFVIGDAILWPDAGSHLLRQGFYLIVILAVILGGRALLEYSGTEALLKGVLVVLTVSCIIILASPVLRELGVQREYRLPFRLTGTFTDPNDAGFVGCLTMVLAVLLLCHGGSSRKLAYSGLTVGWLAGWLSLSKMTALVMLVMWIFFLLSQSFVRQHRILRWLVIPALIGFTVISGVQLHIIGTLSNTTFRTPPGSPETEITSDTPLASPSTETMSPFPRQLSRNLELSRNLDNSLTTARGDLSDYGTSGRRLGYWKMGLEEILASPIVGNGLSHFRYLDSDHLTHDFRPAGIHNVYLLLLGEAGIVPLSLYLLFLFSLLRLHWILPGSLARDAIVASAIIMVLYSGMFQHMLYMGAYTFLTGLSCALAGHISKAPRPGFS